ncbi:hypothetical protein FWG95_04355 [Candidatus Saccharibacteria bacterium]|nr:hypothetical protein [Candidatus Saccharibacteria bacterium]
MTWQEILGIISMIVGISSSIPYVIAIVKKQAVPQRITWLLFTMLSISFLTSAIMTGGNVWFTVGQLIGPAAILGLSIKYGTGGGSRLDAASLIVAAVAFVLLFIVDSKLAGLLLALLIDVIGASLTIKKVLKQRGTEPKLAWAIGSLGGLLGILSVVNFSFENLLFPIYIFVFTTFMFLISKGKWK